jgi:hypothetical protein
MTTHDCADAFSKLMRDRNREGCICRHSSSSRETGSPPGPKNGAIAHGLFLIGFNLIFCLVPGGLHAENKVQSIRSNITLCEKRFDRVSTEASENRDTPDQKHSPAVPEGASKAKPLSVLGWGLGATSLLNLVHDLAWVELYNKLLAWLDAYSFLIHRLGSFLFGWIRFKWISVSTEEHHVLVLASILLAAQYRGQLHRQREKKGQIEDRSGPIGIFLFCFLMVLAPMLLLPGYWGLGCSVVMLMLLLLAVTTGEVKPEDDLPHPSIVKRELIGVGGTFLLFVAINYGLLRA